MSCLKHGRARPAGQGDRHALASLGFAGVGEVRQGKLIELELAETDPRQRARPRSRRCASKLLANTVIESYRIETQGLSCCRRAGATPPRSLRARFGDLRQRIAALERSARCNRACARRA